MSVAEIYGYDDIRPVDQKNIEIWIKAYVGGGGGGGSASGKDGNDKKKADAKAVDVDEKEEAVDDKLKKGLEEQSSLVWKVRDLTTEDKSKSQLSTKVIKSILELNNIKSLSSPDQYVKRLAECIVFGVPPPGDSKKGLLCITSNVLFCRRWTVRMSGLTNMGRMYVQSKRRKDCMSTNQSSACC